MKGGKGENPGLRRLIEQVFSRHGDRLSPVRYHARNFASLIQEADPFIQESTGKVCPKCEHVCCINKHSYHTHFDVLYLRALGETVPSHMKGIADSKPCQFLSPGGCRLGRFLRPYRCTWYFCTPLLEHIRNTPARRYRAFISCLEQISLEREVLLAAFLGIARETGFTAAISPHDFY